MSVREAGGLALLASLLAGCGSGATADPSPVEATGGFSIGGAPFGTGGAGSGGVDASVSGRGGTGSTGGFGGAGAAPPSCASGICACTTSTAPDFCPGVGCVALGTDPVHCGGCDVTCSSGQTCVAGVCTCGGTAMLCGGTCVDLSSDAAHCGRCDTACAPGETCAGGACACESGRTCDGQCVAVNDPAHCGGCDHACSPGESCANDACVCVLPRTACDGACADLAADTTNCGACGHACRASEVCAAGECGCGPGLTWCDSASACVDLKKDDAHCGGCDVACPPGQPCAAGSCGCAGSEIWCAGAAACVDVTTDRQNCGACGAACHPGERCTTGKCACPESGSIFCASVGGCVDPRTDSLHCGGCDQACPKNAECSAGSCVCVAPGALMCSGACVDPSRDSKNCGSCGHTCPTGFACSGGVCGCPQPTASPEQRLTNTPTDTWAPRAAWDGKHVGVVYLDGSLSFGLANVYFALLNPDGSRAVTPDIALTTFKVSDGNGINVPPAIVWTGTEYGILWTQSYVNDTRTLLARLKPSGAAVTAPADVTQASGGYPVFIGLWWSAAQSSYASTHLHLAFPTVTLEVVPLGPLGTAPVFGAGLVVPDISDTIWPSLAASPTAGWVIAANTYQTADLGVTDKTGTVVSSSSLAQTSVVESTPNPSVATLYDGATYFTAWSESQYLNDIPGSQRRGRIYVNRGTAVNSPVPILIEDEALNNTLYRDVLAAQGPGPGRTVAVAWTRIGARGESSLHFRRVGLPSDVSSKVVALDAPTDVLVAAQIPDARDAAIVQAGTSLFALWADDRYGALDIVLRRYDFGGCY